MKACIWVCWNARRPPKRCCWPSSRLYRQVAPKLSDVAGGLDVVLRDDDLSVFIDDEGGPDHPLHRLAIHLLLPVGTPGRQHLAVGIRQQRKRQALGIAERSELLRLVGEIPTTLRPAVVKSPRLSRKSQACLVHPGVEAAG